MINAIMEVFMILTPFTFDESNCKSSSSHQIKKKQYIFFTQSYNISHQTEEPMSLLVRATA